MIICSKCRINKSDKEFHFTKGKRRKVCKICRTAYYRDWYKKNGRSRAIDYMEAIMEWQRNNPEKKKAHDKVFQAIKMGKIIKPISCSECLREKRLSAHHNNYSRPLDVLWLCSSCHKKKHLTK